MKKMMFLGFIAFTALSVTSCSNDEVMEAVPQKQAIEFGTYLGRDAQARGVKLADENLLNFGVFASYTSGSTWTNTDIPNFMFNQNVSRATTSDNWTYTPKKYWPTKQANEFISFFAYAPYYTNNNCISVKSSNNSTGAPIITYTIAAENLETMADFTADVQMNETKTAAGATPDRTNRNVNFGFKHELTRLAIQAKLDRDAYAATGNADKTKINIKKIDFKGNGFATVADYTFATTTDLRGSWSHTTNATLSIEAGANGSVLIDNNNASPLWLANYTTKGYLLEDDDAEKLFGEDNYLFLIPPTAAGIVPGDEVSMVVYYDIVTEDSAVKNGYSISSAIKQIDLPTNQGLLTQGAAYNFTLTFNLNEVTFTASVDADWGTEGTLNDNVSYPNTDI